MKKSLICLVLICLVALPLAAAPATSWEIVRADYGSGNRWVDVTQHVRSMIQGDSLNFTVNGSTLTGDSRRGRNRALRMQLRDSNGSNRTVTYRDRQQVNLQILGSNQGTLRITRAQYGANNRFTDVTDRLNSAIRNDRLSMQVNNDTMGGDPVNNVVKTLRVGYTFNGRSDEVVINENGRLELPGSYATSNQLHINRAQYGANDRFSDVTNRLNSAIRNNSLSMQVNNDTMGGDPINNVVKTLRVGYTYNGRSDEVVVNESGRLELPRSQTTSNQLRITRARYGANNRFADVTNRLNAAIRNNSLSMQVNNDTMGGDPIPDVAKTLTIAYTYNDRSEEVVLHENQQVNLPNSYSDPRNYSENGLQINRAVYGWENHTADVTSRLNQQVQGDRLSLRVSDENMGGDPAPGHGKTLTVQYTIDGRASNSTVKQDDMLYLPSNNYNQSGLQINRAVYGWENRTADVTSRLNQQVQGDQLNLQVTDENMGGDPAQGHSKKLTVDYSRNGQTSQMVTNQGDTLHIPYGNNNGSGLTRRINCESLQSNGYGRNYCPVDARGGVHLGRTLGDSNCVQGDSWGNDSNGIWVDKGCRGEFILQGTGSSNGNYSAVTIPNGTELSVRTNEIIDSKTANVDQTYSAVVSTDVLDNSGYVTIPKGSDARLVIRSVSGGSITSSSDLVLDVDSLTVSGTKYTVSTGDLTQKGGDGVGANKKTAIMVGGGAAVGTIIGAIVGGGKGAAIGAAIGAGGGAGAEILTKGKQVRVPAETILNFRLDQDLRLQSMR